MSLLMQYENKNTQEKGHDFEPRNPCVPALKVVILNLNIPAFRVLIQKCISAIRVHFNK